MMRAEYEDIQSGGAPVFGESSAGGAERMALAGVAVEDCRGEDIIARLGDVVARGDFLRLAFLNAHCVNLARRDEAYRKALARCVVLPDGIGVDLGAQLLHGRKFAENLNGTDFVPRFFREAKTPLKIGLVGGAPGVAVKAADTLRSALPEHEFVAVSDGFFGEAGRDAVLVRLEEGQFDVVLVAMGVPAQERFMVEHLDARHGRILIGVGALFDFLAGNVARAPLAVRKLRLEWAWRLGLEPSRLWRRYVLGNPLFIAEILRDRLTPRSVR
ncbi:WecB/TagA/CpsF family glycosyltransferase [Fulvimarina sp. MAC8]|uniref:WecB/TagA/CpsF family glycosyltransferase n=1 Tax=Fulvimarina sp. MAC8 TaxID=3162874 RepID=UPI0032ECD4C3